MLPPVHPPATHTTESTFYSPNILPTLFTQSFLSYIYSNTMFSFDSGFLLMSMLIVSYSLLKQDTIALPS